MSFIIAGVAVVLSVAESNAEADAQEEAIKANRIGARMAFSATEDSVNIMKAVNREQTVNAMGEQLRVGYANTKKTKIAVDKAISTSLASSEGLTSGRSKGRSMISMYINGSKAIQEADAKTRVTINSLVDNQDKVNNQLNNKLLSAHQELSAILSNTGSKIDGTTKAISAGISGGMAGASL